MNRNPHVAVVGATGAVGAEMINTLEKRGFPTGRLTLLASARSAGKKLKFRGEAMAVRELTKDSFAGIDIALFSAGGGISREFAPVAARAGCVVIDNSSAFRMDDYTKEEMKMQNEGRKIMHHPTFRASVTCVRVPVYRAHPVAVSAEFDQPVTPEAARDVLKKAPGLDVVDKPEKAEYPLPLYAAEKDNCQVGRIRRDCALENGLCFWVSGDQLLKGAALNAVQIAEELLK